MRIRNRSSIDVNGTSYLFGASTNKRLVQITSFIFMIIRYSTQHIKRIWQNDNILFVSFQIDTSIHIMTITIASFCYTVVSTIVLVIFRSTVIPIFVIIFLYFFLSLTSKVIKYALFLSICAPNIKISTPLITAAFYFITTMYQASRI